MIKPSNPQTLKEDLSKYAQKCRTMLHSQGVIDQVAAMLKGPDPVQKVATVGVMIAQRMDAAIRESGEEVQDSIKVAAGYEIIGDIADILAASGGADLNKDLRYLAYSVSVQDYIKAEIKDGHINAQELKVSMARDIRSLPPKYQKDIAIAPARIQALSRKYNHGKGLASFPPDGGSNVNAG